MPARSEPARFGARLPGACAAACAWLALAGIAVLPETAQGAAARHARLPNIVVILADDAGVETIGAYGGENRTPRIDELARQGIRYDNAHATPLCTPSRVRLLTGRYSFRNYRAFGHLDPREPNLARLLQHAGYRTAVTGKWQLAGNPLDGVAGTSPSEAGFDEWRVWHAGPRPWEQGCQHWGPTLETNGHRETYPGEFGSDLVNRFALDFIDRNARQPFFLFYSMILPHDPWVGTPVRRTVSGQQEQFAAMVEYMDSLVGSVLDRLDKDGIASRTLVVFLADNGTHPMISSLRNGVRVQGGKGSTLDAGTHVPLIMRWPARFKARQPSEQLVDLVDVYATILAAAGQTEAVRVSDGYDLTPGVTDRGGPRRQSIFMDYARGWWPLEPTRYAFTSRWKLYGDGRFFDTQSDPLESRPLSPGQISEEAAGTHAMLSRTLAEMHDHPMTASDPHFPAGFDPTTVDLTGATRQLAEMNRECGDPARIP